MKKGILSIIAAGALTAGLLTACSTPAVSPDAATAGGTATTAAGSSEGAAAQTGAHADALKIAFTSEPPQISTCDHDSLISVGINMLTFNGLTRIDNESLLPEMDLAESYTVENDVDWIFKLKQGVKFHNGADFTAEDVVATIAYAKTFAGSSNYTKNIASVEAVDDYTVKITTTQPYAGLLYDLGYHYNWILDKDLIDEGHDFNADPIGTGPYKFVDWKKGESLNFTRFDDYFDKDRAPKIKDLTFTIIPEGASRTIALESGEVDFVWEVNGADAATIEADDSLYLHKVDTVDNVILFFNNDREPYNDANFRHAINCAINRDDIISGALNGYGLVNYSSLAQGLEGWSDEGADQYDLAKAKEYLAAWGGDPSSVTMKILVSNEVRATIGTIIQANLSELGINAEVEQLDVAAYFDEQKTGNFDTYIASWSPSNSLTYVQRFDSARRESNPGAFGSPETDAMIEEAAKTLDDDARYALIKDIVTTVNEQCPQVSLYQTQWLRAYNKDLQGVVLSGTGYTDWNMMYWK